MEINDLWTIKERCEHVIKDLEDDGRFNNMLAVSMIQDSLKLSELEAARILGMLEVKNSLIRNLIAEAKVEGVFNLVKFNKLLEQSCNS